MAGAEKIHVPGVVTGEALFVEPADTSLDLASVLVVDDSASMAKILDRLLISLGIPEVAHASEAAAAFKLMHERLYDLVLLDIEMEKVSGIELLHAIRGRAQTRHLPVVMMTASRKVDYIVASKAGADVVLKAKMHEALTRRRLQDRGT